jgi:CubicO group peptidase (beta-lactamase class C family)
MFVFSLFWIFFVVVEINASIGEKKCQNVSNTLESDIQSVVSTLANRTGFAISVGYVDSCGNEIAAAAGSRGIPSDSNTTTPNDRYTYGSGTKGLTATAVMRLVDRNILKLEDRAYVFIDRALKEFNKTLAETLGKRVENVTVGQLIQMRSGVSDFDVPDFDNYVLKNSNRTYTPLDFLSYVSSLSDEICEADYAGNCKCRFQFEPGTQVAYSSTNFVLAGLVLVGAQSNVTTSWKEYDMARQGLGLQDSSSLEFFTDGALNRWLDVGGLSVQYGKTIIYDQDASIMGWTCGNAVATALDMAKFYYNLLGPPCSFVSRQSLDIMTTFRTLSEGWAKGYIDYGTGLMIQNMSPAQYEKGKRPTLNQSASYVGHAGDTYGFLSDNGWYPNLDASISLVVNEDTLESNAFTCHIIQTVIGDKENLGCQVFPEQALYECMESFGGKVCVESLSSRANYTHLECLASCSS